MPGNLDTESSRKVRALLKETMQASGMPREETEIIVDTAFNAADNAYDAIERCVGLSPIPNVSVQIAIQLLEGLNDQIGREIERQAREEHGDETAEQMMREGRASGERIAKDFLKRQAN